MKADYVHLTLDGEYVTCIPHDDAWYRIENLRKVAFSYPGHLLWVKGDFWHSVMAESLPYVHWVAVATKDVPDCVKLARLIS